MNQEERQELVKYRIAKAIAISHCEVQTIRR